MVDLMETGTDAIVGFKVHDEMNVNDVRQISRALDYALEREPKVGVLADVTELEDVTIKGLTANFREGLRRVADLDTFTRMALVGDQGWVDAVAKIEHALIPGVHVKAFPSEKLLEARTWVAEA